MIVGLRPLNPSAISRLPNEVRAQLDALEERLGQGDP